MSQPPPSGEWSAGATPSGPSGPRADFWYRLGGLLIDAVILGVAGNVIALAFEGFYMSIVIGLVLGVGYSVYFIGSPSGQTVGMKVLNIRVIDVETSGPIDYSRAAMRYLVSIVSGIPCYLGYFWMLWDPEKQTWQDKAVRTYVVPTSAYPVERWPG
jgi:uncharacterized RDD family membrane protein YckC